MKQRLFNQFLLATASLLLVAGLVGCNDNRKDVIETARLNGMLRYKTATLQWAIKNNVKINLYGIDAIYYDSCKTCY